MQPGQNNRVAAYHLRREERIMPAFHAAKQASSFSATFSSTRRSSSRPVAKGHGRRPEGHRNPSSPRDTYRAGELVMESGIYEAIHERSHRAPHDVVMIESDLFPPCDTCSDQVRFRLIRSAPYIFTDGDFEKPQ